MPMPKCLNYDNIDVYLWKISVFFLPKLRIKNSNTKKTAFIVGGKPLRPIDINLTSDSN